MLGLYRLITHYQLREYENALSRSFSCINLKRKKTNNINHTKMIKTTRLSLAEWPAQWPADGLDMLVIGGGATGLGVALHGALEKRTVALVEARDFAAGTSSRSTKLLHGGVRYLAQGHLHLVREALRERGVIMQLAPHLSQSLPFVVAEKNILSWLVTSLGLKLYDLLAGALRLGSTQWLSAQTLRKLVPQIPATFAGIRYWDGQFEDARLALALAATAQAEGAHLRNHTRVTDLTFTGQGWQVVLQDELSGETCQLQAKCVVNAAGVWIDPIRQRALKDKTLADRSAVVQSIVRPSQGVHLVVDRSVLPLQEAVLVPKTSDGRVLFALPWLGSTLIGTTDTPRQDAPDEPRATADELKFLFTQTRDSLGVTLRNEDVRSIWVGLRPLVSFQSDGKTADLSREHVIVREAQGFVSVAGGKWTTYRAMAEGVMQALVKAGDLAHGQSAHTQTHRLQGYIDPDDLPQDRLRRAPGLHLLGSYASEVAQIEGHGQVLGLGLTEAVVRFSARHEWAVTVEDILARRWRILFLDARLAQKLAPRVAEILQEETGIDPRLDAFMAVSQQYIFDNGES
ncbi:MAG: Aerobic glycerol-3-phosphate dehydrogenase [Pseudomonadota bacterium]